MPEDDANTSQPGSAQQPERALSSRPSVVDRPLPHPSMLKHAAQQTHNEAHSAGSSAQSTHTLRRRSVLDAAHETEFAVEQVALPAPPPATGRNATIPVTLVRRRARGAARQRSCARLPVVIWLHATGASAAAMRPRLLAYADFGFLAVAIDCRHHGLRAEGQTDDERRAAYQAAVHRCVLCRFRAGPRARAAPVAGPTVLRALLLPLPCSSQASRSVVAGLQAAAHARP